MERFDPSKHPDPNGAIWYMDGFALISVKNEVLKHALTFTWPEGHTTITYNDRTITRVQFDRARERIEDELRSRGALRAEAQAAIGPDNLDDEITALYAVEKALRPLSKDARIRVLAYFADREVGPGISGVLYAAAQEAREVAAQKAVSTAGPPVPP